MIDFEVIHIGKYTTPETSDYTTDYACISFSISGRIWTKIDTVKLDVPPHFIHISAAGSRAQFECNQKRYNWAILLQSNEIRKGLTPYETEIKCAGRWSKFNSITPVTDEHVSGWEGEFLRMHQAFNQPMPLQQFRAQVGVMNILRYMIDRQPDTLRMTPAGKLKTMLDDGLAHDHTLQQLSENCGYSADHLRILFKQEFGITPLEYHNRTRMARAMSLIDNSDLRIKDIAKKSGFTHVPHFCTMFKQTFAMTPTQAIKKLRHE
jgi:AraC-like DNA-binding protein